jgi:hypothetical protein
MELTFQNKREDLQAFYDYMVKETKQGKVMSTVCMQKVSGSERQK